MKILNPEPVEQIRLQVQDRAQQDVKHGWRALLVRMMVAEKRASDADTKERRRREHVTIRTERMADSCNAGHPATQWPQGQEKVDMREAIEQAKKEALEAAEKAFEEALANRAVPAASFDPAILEQIRKQAKMDAEEAGGLRERLHDAEAETQVARAALLRAEQRAADAEDALRAFKEKLVEAADQMSDIVSMITDTI